MNDRNQEWQYDAAGNVVHTVEFFTNISDATYDAAGELISSSQTQDTRTTTISQTYDGDGQPVKRIEQRPSHTSTIYYVRSSVMGGQVVTELNAQGQKTRGYVYASGQVLAIQSVGLNGASVYWRHIEPVTESFVEINQNRAVLTVFDTDPVGAFLGTSDPFDPNLFPTYDNLIGDRPSHDIDADPFDSSSGCTLDGVPINCNLAMQMVNNGAAVVAPLKSIVPIWNRDQNRFTGFEVFSPASEEFERLNKAAKNKPVMGRYKGNPSNYTSRWVGDYPDEGDSISVTVGSQSSQTYINVTYLGDMTYRTVTSRRPAIEGILYGFLRLQPCLDAFAELGIDLQELLATGLVIGPMFYLSKQGEHTAQELGISQRALDQGAALIGQANALTLPQYYTYPQTSGPNTSDPRARMFLAPSVLEDYNDLKRTLAHELIHGGGYPGKRQGFFKALVGGQDLDYLEDKMKAVMRACGEAPTPP